MGLGLHCRCRLRLQVRLCRFVYYSCYYHVPINGAKEGGIAAGVAARLLAVVRRESI